MIKTLRKTLLMTFIVIIGISTLMACSKKDKALYDSTITVEQPSITAEETMDKFMEIRKTGDMNELYKLMWPKYVEIEDTSKYQYIIAMTDYDALNSIKIIDYKIDPITDYDENIKKTKVTVKYTDSSKAEKSEEANYALIKENDIWKVSPDGAIDAIDYNSEYKISDEKKLFIYVTKDLKYIDRSILKFKVVNNSGSDFSLGGTYGYKTIVDTDKGQYIAESKTPLNLIKGLNDILTITVPNVSGTIKQITITSVTELGQDGLPIQSNPQGSEIVIIPQ